MIKAIIILILTIASVGLVGSLATLFAGMIYNEGTLIAIALVSLIASALMIEGAFLIDEFKS